MQAARTMAERLLKSWTAGEATSPTTTEKPTLRVSYDEETPLLSSTRGSETSEGEMAPTPSPVSKNKLSMFFGVTVPCILSIFSVILFLRMGYILGQGGFLVTMAMLLLAYVVVVLTVLSVSAIATSGSVQAGGVYFMISRSLGPEFGGSIGVIFFVANVLASALNIIGLVEAVFSSFRVNAPLLRFFHASPTAGIPELPTLDTYWIKFALATGFLLFCGVVCLIGAGLFAKASSVIFLCVMVAIASIMVSYGTVTPQNVTVLLPYDSAPGHCNNRTIKQVYYSSWNTTTFYDNILPDFSLDLETCELATFQTVFALLFTGVTGIMAGANISGDLRHPSTAIPQGTLLACAITFIIYFMIFVLTAFTSTRALLLGDNNFLQDTSIFPPLITIGVFSATLSAGLSCLIGASRILYAISKDRIFGRLLYVFSIVVGKKKEPLFAVIASWIIVQLLLFMDKLNVVAPIATIFFLLSYAGVNIACLTLRVASAPNFRPSFQAYSRTSAFLGFLACVAMMFVVQPLFSAVAIVVMLILFMGLFMFGPATEWGDVSQALIFYQVRKFLLRLDIRKSHVKFWRPQILLLVASPRSAYSLIDFTNDLKKGGLYVLGHVIKGPFNQENADHQRQLLPVWLNFVDVAKVKAFVEITVAESYRLGAQSLLMTTGLGGMKPNTLAVGFYSNDLPLSSLDRCERALKRMPKPVRTVLRDRGVQKLQEVRSGLPELRTNAEDQSLTAEEYCHILRDAILFGKNVLILRHFEKFNKPAQLKERGYLDVWPWKVDQSQGSDYTSLLVLQLSTVLHMVSEWRSLRMRVFKIVEADQAKEQLLLEGLLKDLRIEAEVHMVAPPSDTDAPSTDSTVFNIFPERAQRGFYESMNQIIRQHSEQAVVVFMSLPSPPKSTNMAQEYIQQLSLLTDGLPPSVMVYGNMPVISTSI